jgi:hypothetical protein
MLPGDGSSRLTSSSSSGGSTGDIAEEKREITILPLFTENRFEVILECKVESLRGEVPNDIGSISSPERLEAFFSLRNERTIFLFCGCCYSH